MKNYLHQDVGFNLFKDIINRQYIPLIDLFRIHHTSAKRAYEFFKLHFGTTPGAMRKSWGRDGIYINGQYDIYWQFDYEGDDLGLLPAFNVLERTETRPLDRVLEVIIDRVHVRFPQPPHHQQYTYASQGGDHVLISNPCRVINLNHKGRLLVDVRYSKSSDGIRMYLVDAYDRPLKIPYVMEVKYHTRKLDCLT